MPWRGTHQLAPASGRVIAHAHVGDGPAALAFAAGTLWVANSLDATVTRVDPGTLTVRATIPHSLEGCP